MCEMPRLEGVGGNPVPTLVSTEVSVDIGVGTYKSQSWADRKLAPIIKLGLSLLALTMTVALLRSHIYVHTHLSATHGRYAVGSNSFKPRHFMRLKTQRL